MSLVTITNPEVLNGKELNKSWFAPYLSNPDEIVFYDEYDVIFEGTLEIEIDGRIVSGGPGDIIYIPKGSHIHFQTPNKTRYAYFVYPANWAEL